VNNDVNNNDQNNVLPIWQRIYLIYFRKIANRFAYGTIRSRQR